MPPSVNHLYIKRRGGGIALSEAANKYREHVKKVLSTRIIDIGLFPADDPNIVYGIDVTCYFKKLELPEWFEFFDRDTFYKKDVVSYGRIKHKKGDIKNRKGERKAKSRYKKIDIDNRVKFVQDCIVRGLGIVDDSQIFEGTQRKVQDTNLSERVEVCIYVAEHGKFFPDKSHA